MATIAKDKAVSQTLSICYLSEALLWGTGNRILTQLDEKCVYFTTSTRKMVCNFEAVSVDSWEIYQERIYYA